MSGSPSTFGVKSRKTQRPRVNVGQVGNLRRIGNPPVNDSGINLRPITNRPQVTNLPHTKMVKLNQL